MQKVKENVPLALLTTFEIGGPARYLVDVRSEADIKSAIKWAKEKNVRFVLLAGGSNVLIPDEGLDALVIRLRGDLYGFKEGMLDAWAGTNLLATIKAVGSKGHGGWEKLAGIPGTIGGAIRGNAGAFGSEIKDFARKIRALNVETGEIREFSNAECDFSYRHSFFKDHPEWVITRVALQLREIGPEESAKLAEETIAEREKRHLQNVKAAGSYFMNPVAQKEIVEMFEKEKGVKSRESRVPAGWLIEKAGMKGATVGGAIASLQHPNYLVNQGNATAEDVRELAEKVREAVRSKFTVELHEEAALL
ncbi:MAG TPA: UDP-N-acetylmuramate dehydrogenase [Candidatus Paceibacterota bacterium]|nr:UDP-N-acetylmuramate dehydrogenase [Candidatus Paceibacterota bacterium]